MRSRSAAHSKDGGFLMSSAPARGRRGEGPGDGWHPLAKRVAAQARDFLDGVGALATGQGGDEVVPLLLHRPAVPRLGKPVHRRPEAVLARGGDVDRPAVDLERRRGEPIRPRIQQRRPGRLAGVHERRRVRPLPQKLLAVVAQGRDEHRRRRCDGRLQGAAVQNDLHGGRSVASRACAPTSPTAARSSCGSTNVLIL